MICISGSTRLSRKSDTAAAIRYALSRWRALGRYLDDGSIEIDNSAAERSLRAVVLGRKNYLFMGSDEGGSYVSVRANPRLTSADVWQPRRQG
jgi:hypothetical protein